MLTMFSNLHIANFTILGGQLYAIISTVKKIKRRGFSLVKRIFFIRFIRVNPRRFFFSRAAALLFHIVVLCTNLRISKFSN